MAWAIAGCRDRDADFTYTFLNIGMTISITPITGLPLPLISYGGSFL